MRRGFKAQAERASDAARSVLKITHLQRFDAKRYAAHLGVVLLNFNELNLSEKCKRQLTINDGDSWSALTIKEKSCVAVILNPSHAETRLSNDLMHELAHIELKHVPVRVEVSQSGVLLLGDYSENDEQEADWLAATHLLPRTGLVHYRAEGKTPAEIAHHYGVSKSLCDWRLRMTGVDTQIRRRA